MSTIFIPLLGVATLILVLAVYGFPTPFKGSKFERMGRLRIAVLVCTSVYGFVVLSFSIPVQPLSYKGPKIERSLGQLLFSSNTQLEEESWTYR
ncbi:MAG: hypothetical protein IPJ49_11910 [Candidatus Obscuribacter sp.]|nr:hypothetical protein [Candidatus Obscuribacter sp.]